MISYTAAIAFPLKLLATQCAQSCGVFEIDHRTVEKMLGFSVPPDYRRSKRVCCPKLDPFVKVIDKILREDSKRPKKQRHTSKPIFERLRFAARA